MDHPHDTHDERRSKLKYHSYEDNPPQTREHVCERCLIRVHPVKRSAHPRLYEALA